MPSANFINRQREKLGLTQDELAGYLNVSRSLLALAERNERELPTAAHLLLMELVVPAEAGVQDTGTLTTEEQAVTDAMLMKRLKDKEWQLQQLRQKYERLTEAHQSKKRRRQVAGICRNNEQSCG